MKKPVLFTILKIGTILSAMIAMLILAGQNVLEWWLVRQFAGKVSDGAGSIGIIGGADGPTAIFVTTTSSWGSPYIWAGGFAVLALAGFITLLIMKKKLN